MNTQLYGMIIQQKIQITPSLLIHQCLLTIPLILILLLSGCATIPPPPSLIKPEVTVSLLETQRQLQTSRLTLDNNLVSIDQSTTAIEKETDSGKLKAPALVEWISIKKDVDDIRSESENARKELGKLIPIERILGQADVEVTALSHYTELSAKELEALQITLTEKEEIIKKYEKGSLQKQHAIWIGVTALAALGIVVGIAMSIWASPKMGVPLVIACSILTCVSYFMVKYALLVAIVGGILIFIALGAAIWAIAINRKALVESILSFQFIKDKSWSTDPTVRENVKQIQSNSTRKIVSQIKVDKQI